MTRLFSSTSCKLMFVFAVTSTSVASAQSCSNGMCRLNSSPSFGPQNAPSAFNDQNGYVNDYRLPASLQPTSSQKPNCANGSCGPNCTCANGSDCNCAATPSNSLTRNPDLYRSQDSYRNFNFAAPVPATRPQLTNYSTGRGLFDSTSVPGRNGSFDSNVIGVPANLAATNWQTDFQTASRYAQQSGQPMLVRVTADWCGYCQQMKKETFADMRIIRDAQRFVTIEVNADTNRQLITQMGVKTLPTTLVVSPDLRIVDRLDGFRTAAELSRVLQRHSQRAELETSAKVAVR